MKKLFSICIVLLCQMAAFAQSENTKHTVTVLADPKGSSWVYSGGWGSDTSFEKETGQQVNVTVYPNTGYVLDTLVSAEIDIKNVSDYSNEWAVSFTMPDKDVTITAHAHYAPELPPNPNESGWDEGTGSIIVNAFTPGKLQDAIYKFLYDPEIYNTDFSKVKAITAVGVITEDDWLSIFLYDTFKNLTYLDLSRTTGLSEMGTRYYNPGSSKNETLTTLLLPATIESIENYAYFDRLEALKSLTCYATTPPKIIANDFGKLPADVVVYVPAESLPLYMEADEWKELEIQPITQGVHSLTVNLPKGTTAGSFKDLFLELVNTQTARVQRYVMTNSTKYTFPNLINDTHYNIYVRNLQGDILARMEGVDVKGQNVSVTLSNMTIPQDITLQLITPEGKDVTDQATTTWTDQRGNYIATGNTLGSQMAGAKVRFSVRLPEALGILYQLPTDSLITVGENATLSVCLQPLKTATLSGTVTAASTGSPIRDANVSVTQLLNGRYSQTLTAATDADGNWTLTVPDAPATITAAATDYVSSTMAVEAFPVSTPVAFALRDLTGTTLYLNIYYRPAVREGEMMDGDDTYADYQSISYSVYDETHQKELTNLKVQYPYLVLQDEVLEEGTQLRVTATSSTGAFMPVTATCQVKADDSTIVTLPITQLGQLKATFSQTDNLAVVGMLYDGDGNLKGTYSYDEAQLTLTDIPDGNYTLVTMGESRLFNGINTLDGLTEMQLVKGRDYVSNTVSIESGRIDSLHNQVVPSFDESVFSYTSDDTRFSANKTQVTVGNYVTLRTQVTYKSSVTPRDVKLLFDLPEGCALVEGSVMAGTSLVAYSMDGNRLTVPLINATDIVRFCVVPTKEGYYETQASVTFTSAARERMQPLGSVGITAEALSISVPQRSGSSIVPVSGMAIGGSLVQIYDDDVLIGQTEAGPAGNWKVQCALNNPYNLSEHAVHALITTPEGLQMQTGASSVTISHGTLKPVVTMSFDQDGRKATLTWDFRTNTVSSPTYWARYVNSKFPVGFDINMMKEDEVVNDTMQVSNVVLYVLLEDNTVMTLYPRYNTKKGCWYAAFNYDIIDAMPINVYVDFVQNDDLKLDRQQLEDAMADAEANYEENRQMLKEVYNDFTPEGLGVDQEAAFRELDDLLDRDDLDDAVLARRDSLFNVIIDDPDIIAKAEAKYAIDFSEVDALYDSLDPNNPDPETVLLISRRTREIMAAATQPDDDPDEAEMTAERTRMQALTDSIITHAGVFRDVVLNSMEWLVQTTDTTALQKPEDGYTDVVRWDDGYQEVSYKKLNSIDSEQLLVEGYTAYPMTDGTFIYLRKDGETMSYVDAKTLMLCTVKTVDDESFATKNQALRRAPSGKPSKFPLLDSGCLLDIIEAKLKLFKQKEQMEDSKDNYSKFKTTCATIEECFSSTKDALGCIYDAAMNMLQPKVDEDINKCKIQGEKDLKNAENDVAKWKQKIAEKKAAISQKERYIKELERNEKMLAECVESGKNPYFMTEMTKELEDVRREMNAAKNEKKLTEKFIKNFLKPMLKESKTAVKESQKFLKGLVKNQNAIMRMISKLPKTFQQALKIGRPLIELGGGIAKFLGTPIGGVFKVLPLAILIGDNWLDIEQWKFLSDYIEGKLPCPGDQDKALQVYEDTKGKRIQHTVIDVSQVVLDAATLVGDFCAATVPVVSTTWWLSLLADCTSIFTAIYHPRSSADDQDNIRSRIDALECDKKPKPDPKPTKPTNTHTLLGADRNWETICYGNPCPESTPVRDPSGFVYEAVNSNRLEGVTATCYYKETVEDMYGDLHENIVVWDAENYAQKNPLFTDAEGKYAWDVPQGLWQVKFEKEGYETKRSEWLPVPPPQLEVNVGMTQLRQPMVSRVKAYPEGIDITFDKYMDPQTLTKENILVTTGGKTVQGTLCLLNTESGYEKPDVEYASKVRFEPTTPLTVNDKVQLTVRKTVESYAGIPMESDYTQQFDVELRVLSIETDSLLYLADDATQSLTIQALPVEAAKGKRLSVTSMNPDVVDLSTDALTLDANGQTQVNLTATGLGTSAVKFSMMDDDLTATTLIYVADVDNMMVVEPTSSRMSGTEIYRGTEIKLACETAGATILYTLDGSCPCDADSKKVLTYQGPIMAVGDNLVIRAMAVANGMGESDVVEFHYKVIDLPVVIETITESDGISMKVPVTYYRLDGRRIREPQRGINIVRRADGIVYKIFVK